MTAAASAGARGGALKAGPGGCPIPAHVEGLGGPGQPRSPARRPWAHSSDSFSAGCGAQEPRALPLYSRWVPGAIRSREETRAGNQHRARCETVPFTGSHCHRLLQPPTRRRFMHTFEAFINDMCWAEGKKRSTRILSCGKMCMGIK